MNFNFEIYATFHLFNTTFIFAEPHVSFNNNILLDAPLKATAYTFEKQHVSLLALIRQGIYMQRVRSVTLTFPLLIRSSLKCFRQLNHS